MTHVFEPAASGRSKCRGCAQAIRKGELRFGEAFPNLFGDGDMTVWFHPLCAAYKRPQAVLEGLAATSAEVPERDKLERAARASAQLRRLPRIDGAERSPTSQARCRSCREFITRGSWRIRLAFHEEGHFSPGGFVHLQCRAAYFETGDILEQALHFSRELSADDRAQLEREFAAPLAAPKAEAD